MQERRHTWSILILPISSTVLTLSGLWGQDVYKRQAVNYGGALRASDFPEIPAKDGCFAEWTDFDSSFITFPVEVEAIYTPYVTVIESGEQSENGFPLVLADGLFDDGSTLKVSTQSSSVFPPDNNSELRLVSISGNVNGGVTQLRFLAPEGRGSLNVMQYVNGSWKSLEFTQNGHYLIVEDPALDGNSGFFCVQLQKLEWVPVVIIGGCVLIALINIVPVSYTHLVVDGAAVYVRLEYQALLGALLVGGDIVESEVLQRTCVGGWGRK